VPSGVWVRAEVRDFDFVPLGPLACFSNLVLFETVPSLLADFSL
jgi:hypothetical protein